MPRLPRVISTHDMPVCSSSLRPARSSARLLSSIFTPSTCSTSDSFGVQAVRPRYRVSAYRESIRIGTLGFFARSFAANSATKRG